MPKWGQKSGEMCSGRGWQQLGTRQLSSILGAEEQKLMGRRFQGISIFISCSFWHKTLTHFHEHYFSWCWAGCEVHADPVGFDDRIHLEHLFIENPVEGAWIGHVGQSSNQTGAAELCHSSEMSFKPILKELQSQNLQLPSQKSIPVPHDPFH